MVRRVVMSGPILQQAKPTGTATLALFLLQLVPMGQRIIQIVIIEAVPQMERWFGIPITIKDENLKQERFTGKFVNKESVYQILDIINRSEPIQYTRKNNVIIISRHK